MTGLMKPRRTTWPTLFGRPGLDVIRSDWDDLFSRFFGDGPEGWLTETTIPSLDLSETEKEVEVRMDVPGFTPEKIDVQVHGDRMVVRGEQEEEKKEEGKTYHRVERRTGSFVRTVPLPCPVSETNVEATYRDGVLTVRLPKSTENVPRKIEIKS